MRRILTLPIAEILILSLLIFVGVGVSSIIRDLYYAHDDYGDMNTNNLTVEEKEALIDKINRMRTEMNMDGDGRIE